MQDPSPSARAERIREAATRGLAAWRLHRTQRRKIELTWSICGAGIGADVPEGRFCVLPVESEPGWVLTFCFRGEAGWRRLAEGRRDALMRRAEELARRPVLVTVPDPQTTSQKWRAAGPGWSRCVATCGEFWLRESVDGGCALFHVDGALGLSALAEGRREELAFDAHFLQRTHAGHRMGLGRGDQRVEFEPVLVDNVVGAVRIEEDEFILIHASVDGFVILRTRDDLVVVAERMALEDLRRVRDPPKVRAPINTDDSPRSASAHTISPENVEILKWAMMALSKQSVGQRRGAGQARRAFAQTPMAASRRPCRLDGRRGSVIFELGDLAGTRLNGCDRTQRTAYTLMHRLLPELFELDRHVAAFRGDRLANPADPIWGRLRALAAEAGHREPTAGTDSEEMLEANRVLRRRNEQLEDALAAALRAGPVLELPPEARPPDAPHRPTTVPPQPGWTAARVPSAGAEPSPAGRRPTDPTLTTFDDLDDSVALARAPTASPGRWDSPKPASSTMQARAFESNADTRPSAQGSASGTRPRDRTLTTFDDLDDEFARAQTRPSGDPASPITGPPAAGPAVRPRDR